MGNTLDKSQIEKSHFDEVIMYSNAVYGNNNNQKLKQERINEWYEKYGKHFDPHNSHNPPQVDTPIGWCKACGWHITLNEMHWCSECGFVDPLYIRSNSTQLSQLSFGWEIVNK